MSGWRRSTIISNNMAKKKEKEQETLQLQLTFPDPPPLVVQHLLEALAPYAITAEPLKGDALRKQARRVCAIAALQTNRKIGETWIMAYQDLYHRTGFHAVYEAIKAQKESSKPEAKPVWLDAVEKAGKMEALIEVLAAMLVSGP